MGDEKEQLIKLTFEKGRINSDWSKGIDTLNVYVYYVMHMNSH